MHRLFRCGNDDARGITNNQSNESEDTKELAIDHPRCRQDMDLTEVCQLNSMLCHWCHFWSLATLRQHLLNLPI